ncbi:unnamed protein product [Closterium sp. NIES-54]
MLLARQGEEAAAGKQKGPKDIWEDPAALRWIQGETDEEEQVSDRVRARGHHYRWYQGQLQLQTADGWKLVPAPQDKEGVIKEVHRKLGHFGHERTTELLKTGWWWEGMRRQVREWVSGCEGCQRSKASLAQAKQELQSLPIRGLGFRWSLDIAGELPLSRGGKRYILLMVEHASKWVEVCALPSKDSRHVAKAFKGQVLCRFGAPGEVLTDQGTEFRGEFQALLDEARVTHRLTSRYHPQSDGLTERLVQTLKRNLRAYGEKRKRDWDEELDWIAAGYRFGKQASLKDYSPYSMLFGKEPILPVGAPRVLTDVVQVTGAEQWVALAEARARYMREMLPAALENLHTAQLRDAHRYEQRQQQGGRKARPAVMEGQEVYLRRAKRDTLDVGLGTQRWKVKEVRGSGVLVLENDKGEKTVDHQTNAAAVNGRGPQREGPADKAEESRVSMAKEGLGEDVGQVGLGSNLAYGKKAALDELADEEIAHLDVLGASMVDRVLSEVDGAGIVTPEGGAGLRGTKLSKMKAEPTGFLGGQGASIELGFAGGEGNREGARGAPAAKAAAEGEAIALRGAAVRLRIGPGGVAEA